MLLRDSAELLQKRQKIKIKAPLILVFKNTKQHGDHQFGDAILCLVATTVLIIEAEIWFMH
jgi:hypothetical protein